MTISIRTISEYRALSQPIDRLDILFGTMRVRPEWVLNLKEVYVPSAPAIIGVKELIVLGTAAVLIKNPVVSRRFWSGWAK